MAEIKNVFDISGRAMAAQLVRLNTIASNLANAGNLAGSEDEAYRSLKPVFETQYANEVKNNGIAKVKMRIGTVESLVPIVIIVLLTNVYNLPWYHFIISYVLPLLFAVMLLGIFFDYLVKIEIFIVNKVNRCCYF